MGAVVLFSTLFIVLIGLFVWRLHAKPLDISFAKDYVEQQLQDPASGLHANINGIALHWPDLKGPIYLGAEAVQILKDDNPTAILSIDEMALGLSGRSLFIGKISPLALVLIGPEFSILRDEDGDIDIGFGALGTKDKPSIHHETDDTPIVQQILKTVSKTGGNSNSILSSMRVLEIREARASFQDKKTNALVKLDHTALKIKKTTEGIETHLTANIVNNNEESSQSAEEMTLNLAANIPWSGESLTATLAGQNFNLAFLKNHFPDVKELDNLSGIFHIGLKANLDANLNPRQIETKLASDGGNIVLPDEYPQGLAYKKLVMQASYDRQENTLSLFDTSLTLGEVPIHLSADLNAKQDGMSLSGPVKIKIDDIAHSKIAPIWPQSLKKDSSYEWIVEKISGANFSNLTAGFNLNASKTEENWNIATENLQATFAFENASVDYRSPLIPVTGAKGAGTFNLDEQHLEVQIETAQLDKLLVTEATLGFKDIIDSGTGKAAINVKLEGPINSVLRYVQDEPIGAKHGFDLTKTKGDTALDVKINFPTSDIDIEDVKIDIAGKLTNAVLPNIVKDLTLTGGPFDITLKDNLLSAKGKGKIDGREIDAQYEEFLQSAGKPYKSKVTARLVADPALRTRFGIDLSNFLEGAAPIALTYTDLPSGKAHADINIDLTPAKVFVEAFKEEKPIGTQARASLRAIVQNGNLTEIENLELTAPRIAMAGGNFGFQNNDLTRGKIASFAIGESKGAVEFEIQPATKLQKIVLNAETLDLRPFLSDDEKEKQQTYDEPPKKISITARQMISGENLAVQNGKLYLDIDSKGSFNQFEMDAMTGGQAVYMRYKTDDSGKRTFRLEADDAGSFLKAFGLYDKIQGGKLVIYGEPIRGVNDRNLIGTAEISDFKVVKAPGLAKLLSAMSLPGVMNLLNNEGIAFSKLQANFNWLFRPGGSLLVLKEGRTSGNSVGFTFEGSIDNTANTMDVSGTIVPLSGINKALSDIPLVGQILSGGSGSIFAATYTMKGASNDPKVSVNPLSVLTPGLIRTILFEN